MRGTAALMVLVSMAPSLARAQVATGTAAELPFVFPAEGARTISWYGWETLTFDATFGIAVIVAAVVLSQQHESDVWLAPIGLPYLVATPIAHGVHDNAKEALISAAARAVVPASTYVIIRAACGSAYCRESSTGTRVALWTGFVISLLLAPLIDAGMFAWVENEDPR